MSLNHDRDSRDQLNVADCEPKCHCIEHGDRLVLVEADLVEGVRAIPLDAYETMHTRICRPVGLENDEIAAVMQRHRQNRSYL